MKRLLRAGVLALALGALGPAAAMADVTPTGTPTITGNAVVGGTLTCNTSGVTWMSDDSGTPTTIDYDWYQGSTSGTPVWDSATDGTPTDDTYTPQLSDIGDQLVCTETDQDVGGNGNQATTNASNLSSAVQAGAPPTNVTPPSIQGTPEVGTELICEPGTWNPGVAGDDTEATDYSWYEGSTLVQDGGADSTYTPVAADIGHKLVCKETEEDEETGGTAVAPSPSTSPIQPEASITLTGYSSALSGNIGENVAGVSVTVSLERQAADGSEVTVATATGSTTSTGSWTAALTSGHGFGVVNDELSVAYSIGTATAGTTLPAGTQYQDGGNPDVQFAGEDSQISADGTTISNDQAGCPSLTFIVNGAPHATTDVNGTCIYSPTSPVTDNDHVQASYTSMQSDQNGVASILTAINDVGLPGTGQQAPTCQVDLVFGLVTCSDLNGDSFTVSRNGGSAVALTSTSNGGGTFTGTATIAGLAAGDTIVLKESGGSRAISTLHVGTLRIDVGVDEVVTDGSCQPGEPLESFNFGGGGVCSSAGTMTTGSGDAEIDDLSGGSTTVDVPALADLMPSYGDSMPGGLWTAYADVSGNGNTAQIQAAVTSVSFQIVPHGGGTPAVTGNMTPGSDSVGPFESYTLANALADGRYFANWKLTDSHGDTIAYQDLFAQQPGTGSQGVQGKTGATGATGQQGKQGPQGPAGKSSLVKCTVTTTGKGKKKKTHETCKVSVLAPGTHNVSIDVSRGKRTYAIGVGVVRYGVARLTLRNVRTLTRGRYLVTVVVTAKGKASVSRFYERL